MENNSFSKESSRDKVSGSSAKPIVPLHASSERVATPAAATSPLAGLLRGHEDRPSLKHKTEEFSLFAREPHESRGAKHEGLNIESSIRPDALALAGAERLAALEREQEAYRHHSAEKDDDKDKSDKKDTTKKIETEPLEINPPVNETKASGLEALFDKPSHSAGDETLTVARDEESDSPAAVSVEPSIAELPPTTVHEAELSLDESSERELPLQAVSAEAAHTSRMPVTELLNPNYDGKVAAEQPSDAENRPVPAAGSVEGYSAEEAPAEPIPLAGEGGGGAEEPPDASELPPGAGEPDPNPDNDPQGSSSTTHTAYHRWQTQPHQSPYQVPYAPTQTYYGARNPNAYYYDPNTLTDAAYIQGRSDGLILGLFGAGAYGWWRHRRLKKQIRQNQKQIQKQGKQAQLTQNQLRQDLQNQTYLQQQAEQRHTETTNRLQHQNEQLSRRTQALEKARHTPNTDHARSETLPQPVAEMPVPEHIPIPEGHHIEASAWHNVEVDNRTGRAVENPSLVYGREFKHEQRQESFQAAPMPAASATGYTALLGASRQDDTTNPGILATTASGTQPKHSVQPVNSQEAAVPDKVPTNSRLPDAVLNPWFGIVIVVVIFGLIVWLIMH